MTITPGDRFILTDPDIRCEVVSVTATTVQYRMEGYQTPSPPMSIARFVDRIVKQIKGKAVV